MASKTRPKRVNNEVNLSNATMSRASKYIYSFLDNHLGIYNNRQGIEFVVNNDDSVIVNYWMKDPPLNEPIEFGLCYTSDDFNDFIQDFRFAGTHALQAFTPDLLWEMYYKGQAEVYCIIAEKATFFALYFKLEDNKMIVYDDHNNTYELGKILETPLQFLEYTQKQFELRKG